MFLVLPNVCKHTDTQYHYHTLLPMLCGKGNEQGFIISEYYQILLTYYTGTNQI